MGKNHIPECPVATELIPGDVSVLETLADALASYSASSADASGRMGPLARIEEWGGPAAEGFVEQMVDLPKTLDKAVRHFTDAADALRGYAGALRQAQADVAQRVIPEANAARAWSAQWQLERDAVRDGAVGLSPPDKDLGKERLRDAEDELGRIRGRLKDAQHDFTERIDRGIQAAPSGGDPITTALTSFGGGVKDGVTGLMDTAQMLNPGRAYADPVGYFTDLQRIAGGFQRVVTDPAGFAKDFVDWDEWRKNPARALGLAVPDLTLSLLTGGAGKGAKLLEPDLPKTPDPVDITKKGRPCDTRESCSDPVDPVTGEVSLSATDVHLPGVLPLLLTRRHGSTYRAGRLFGRSWASTLDQHVELEASEAVFHAADGVILRYPLSEPGRPILPYTGSRWPMARDAEPDGVIVIAQPRLGSALTFRAIHPDSTRFVLESVVDRNGNAIAVDYDDYGTLIGVRHSGGYHIAVDTEADRIVGLRLLDAHPKTHAVSPGDELVLARFTYNGTGDLSGVIDSSGDPHCFTYDDEHRMTSWSDRNGTAYHYLYDDAGRCVRTRGPQGILDASFHYDDARRTTRYTNSLGHTTEFEYNEAFQVVRITDPLDHTVRRTWDRRHQLRSFTDQLGRRTCYAYDHMGNVVERVLPDGKRTTAEYDALCLPIRFLGSDDTTWSYTYSPEGRPLTAADPAGGVTSYTVDERGNVNTVVDALGGTTEVVRDAAGLPVETVDPSGAVTRYERDALGRIVRTITPDGAVTVRRWSVEGRPIQQLLPDGSSRAWTWDGEGNPVEYRDPMAGLTRYTVTHFDLPASRTEPDGARYEFAYDSELHLVEVVNPQGRTWSYEYDPLGRLIAETDFNGRELTYRYDPAGQLALRSNGAAEPVSYVRDLQGRVLAQRHEETGRETTFAYDDAGRLVRATNPDVDLVLTRDPVGRITAESTNGRTLTTEFDAVGRRVWRGFPSGRVSEWTYDLAGRPTSLRSAGLDLDFTHDGMGREVDRRFGEDVRFTREWNLRSQLAAQVTTVGATQSTLQAALEPNLAPRTAHRRSYEYRADGHIAAIHDSHTGSTAFDMDPVGRITAVRGGDWNERYAYDIAGNQTFGRWPTDEPDSQGSREVCGSLIRRSGRMRYVHDDQGRLVGRSRKTLSGKGYSWVYRWDADDRLTDVTAPDGTQWRYIYDPLGRRVAKHRLTHDTDVCSTTVFVWDRTRIVEQRVDAVDTSWDYHPVTGFPTAQSISGEAAGGIAERSFVIVTDPVGTPTELVDETGSAVWRAQESIWGSPGAAPSEEGREYCPIGFAGQYRDTESGLRYNYFRYYSPEDSTYISPDPLGLTPAPHERRYVANPLTWSDPLGLAACEVGGPENHIEVKPGRGDALFPSESDAFDEVLRRFGVSDVSTVERIPTWGNNPNLPGPRGEPWEVIRALDDSGNLVEFHHHANGHLFDEDGQWSLPHYHGPNGEHIFYGDMNSTYGNQGRP